MTPATYLRYSTDKQREASCDDQLRNVQTFCTREGWPMPAVYKDEATSGTTLTRAGLDALISAADRKAFDVLIVDDQSRLGRNYEIPLIIERMKFFDIRVIAINNGIDTSRDGYDLLVCMNNMMDVKTIKDTAQRTHRGQTGQVLQGRSAGGRSYGYTSQAIDDGFIKTIVPEQATIVLRIFTEYAAGHGLREIANRLNAEGIPSPGGKRWRTSTLYADPNRGTGLLCNPLYNGQYIWNRSEWRKHPDTGNYSQRQKPQSEWHIIDAPQLRIIPPALWHQVQTRIASTRNHTRVQISTGKHHGGRPAQHILSGLLKCQCGARYIIVNRNRYGCSARRASGHSACSNKLTVDRTLAEQKILAGIKTQLATEANYKKFESRVRALLKQRQPNTTALQRQLATASTKRDNIIKAIEAGIITPSTSAALKAAETTIEQTQQTIAQAQKNQPAAILPRARDIYKQLVDQLENATDKHTIRRAVRELIGEIELIPEPDQQYLVAKITGHSTMAGRLSMVAGAGFVCLPTVLVIPLAGADCGTGGG